MADWREEYQRKLCTAEEAIKLLKSGENLVVGGNRARPEHIMDVLVEHAADYKGVTIRHGLSAGKEYYVNEEYKDNFQYQAFFIPSGIPRKAIGEGWATNIPLGYMDIGLGLAAGRIPCDVFTFQVCPPDEFGWMSCGINADFVPEAMAAADRIIVQVNKEMPRNAGMDCLIHVSQADAIVEFDEPIPESPRPTITDIEQKIGDYCASLVNDGATIQVGIGGIPNAVCNALMGRKDLGVHSEMIADGVVDLVKAGVVNGSKKSMNKGKVTIGFAMGTREAYDYMDDNPEFEEVRIAEVNNPEVIAKCHDFISINSCVEVDLMGQVVAGSAGYRRISGAGGQLDFIKGAGMTHDGLGKAVLAMTSTHKKKGVVHSRIKPFVSEGSSITVPAQDADYFVTEYGIAQVKGKNRRDRARALIEIAHPDFRPGLIEEYEKRFGVKY